ncbi:MAG: phosphatidylserine/phosphatidylglycerophosphate/cardiolipin synthase family protein [Patescibacteria group bacterium]
MRYKVYTKTEKAWDAMIYAISHAKNSILFEMYIFVDDTSDSHDFIEILSQKAASGVKVKIIFDAFGSKVSNDSVKKLRDVGVELFFFRTLFRVTHRKILIVDERIAFIGGINIKKFFKKWDDLSIRMEGRVVERILNSFAYIYKSCGGTDDFVLKYNKILSIQKGKIWFFEHYPPRYSSRLNKYYSDKIEFAKKKILIITPYFMPNHWVVKALKKASKRGVKVEIILPRIATHPKIANVPNYFYMHKLYKHGIKFFLTEKMNHSKIMLVDGEEGILGSQNVDIISFDFNMESGVFFTDLNLIKELEEVIENWKKNSTLYSPKMRNTHLLDIFYDFCFNFFEHVVKFYNKLTRIF